MSGGLIGKVGFGALWLALFLAPLLGGFPAGQKYGHDALLTALRCVALLAALVVPLRPTDRWGGAARWAIGLSAGWSALSLLVASRFLTGDSLLFAMLPATIDGVAAAAFFLLMARAPAERRRLETALLAGFVVTALWTLIGALLSPDPGYRAVGPFFSPNFPAGFLGLCLPVAGARLAAATTPAGALAAGAALACGLGAVAATGSRSGLALALLGLGIALVLAAIQRRGKLPWPRIAAAAAAGLALAGVFGLGVRGPLKARAAGSAGAPEQSGEFRVWTWKGTAQMAQANPVFGTGPGTFLYRYPRYALVGMTDLAHSSYLQTAAEQGIPSALAAVAAVVLALVSGLSRLRREPEEAERWLLCGLIGALTVGAARSVFDSEWSLPGNALPFWAVAGLLATPATEALSRRGGLLQAAALPAFLLAMPPVQAVWPPTAASALKKGNPVAALRIEPSLRLIFLFARQAEKEGRYPEAAGLFARGREIDPNNFQLLRALAETLEKAGDHEAAVDVWRDLVARQEGTFGAVRAIPETTDTHPAYAYAALGDDATARGAADEARGYYAKAAGVIERYSRTAPVYQMQEFVLARPEVVQQRRAALRALYERVADSSDTTRRGETLQRLDGFLPPPGP